MTDDIVARLREFDADLTQEIKDGEHGEDGHLWVIPFDCICEAADEIERLRRERDEARQWLCHVLAKPTLVTALAVPGKGTKYDFAKEQGWDCFKEAES